jgi:hypothetical protein
MLIGDLVIFVVAGPGISGPNDSDEPMKTVFNLIGLTLLWQLSRLPWAMAKGKK